MVSDRRQRQGRTTATLVVQARPRPPIARISPDGSQVNQGARVRFSSTSYHPDRSRRIVRTQWQTSWRQRGSGNFIDVDTGRLSPGTYRVNLQVYDDRGARDSAAATLVVQARARPPVARIDPDRRQVNQGERVKFSSASYHQDRDRRIVRSQWQTSWGQGGTGNSIDIDTSRLNEGNYRVNLEVYDDRGARGSATATLLVSALPKQPPVARIAPRRHEVQQGGAAEFDGRASLDPDGKIQEWSWSLDDRRVGTQPSIRIDTSTLNPGEHRIRLDVRDEQDLTANDEAILTVVQRPRDFDAALVQLDVSPAQTAPNQNVSIRAVVANRGKDTLQNVEVRFQILRTQIGRVVLPSLAPGQSREATATWLAKLPGEHIVVATVNPDNQPPETNRTNNIRRRSILVFTRPEVRIDPNPLEVSQGDVAIFSSRVAFPGQQEPTPVEYQWRGPGTRTGRDPAFEFDTSDLPPGRYKIILELSDRRGFEAKAESTLIIRPVKAEVWLAADNERPQTGIEVRFSGGMEPASDGVEYRFVFGESEETDWMTTPEAIHRYDKPGNYTVRLLARRAGDVIGSKSISVAVTETSYALFLRVDGDNIGAGEALTLIASVEPPVDDIEYQFQFGDGEASGWMRAAAVTHTYKDQGEYTALVVARIAGARIVQSPPVRISMGAAKGVLWLWLGAGVAALGALAAAAYSRKTRRAAIKGSFSVVPRLNLDTLRFETRGKVSSGYVIGLRTVRGRPRFETDRSAPIPDVGKD